MIQHKKGVFSNPSHRFQKFSAVQFQKFFHQIVLVERIKKITLPNISDRSRNHNDLNIFKSFNSKVVLAPSFCGDNCFRMIRDLTIIHLSNRIPFLEVRNDSSKSLITGKIYLI